MLSVVEIEQLVRKKYEQNGRLDRLNHIWGVVKMALFLAERYQVDPIKTQIAAYLHDYYKYESVEEMEQVIRKEDLEECRRYPFLAHAYASAESYKSLGGKDEEIYQAIRNHVFGRPGMSRLEEIILIADFTEEGRIYPACIQTRKTLLDGYLNEAIWESTAFTIDFVSKKGLAVHPIQVAVLNYYEPLREKKKTLKEVVTEVLGKIKAQHVICYDMRGYSPFYDEMILCTVQALPQSTAAVRYMKEECDKNGFAVRSIEGVDTPWVIIDCYSLVCCLFTEEERQRFALDKLYLDLPHQLLF